MLAAGMLSMALGAWLGLVRLGWNLRLPSPDSLILHGPLMVCGFLGTVICLERAVALGKLWGYAAPSLAAAGGLALVAGGPVWVGAALLSLGSAALVAIYAAVWWRHPSLFIVTMGLGAVMWLAGNLRWLDGAAILRVAFWWVAFLVLTIAGERLELSRVLRLTSLVRSLFVLSMTGIIGGAVASARWPDVGARILGAGLVAMAAWLFRNDVARRTVRQTGLTRFMAVCLLSGYAWLLVGGVIAMGTGIATTGPVYDAVLHSVFLGFVMSMVFAHAPIIFPAVVGTAVPYHPAFFLHVGVLHVSVVFRVGGDLIEVLGRWRVWGGMLNAIALLLFVVGTVRAVISGWRRI
jgi:hypothetical protein